MIRQNFLKKLVRRIGKNKHKMSIKAYRATNNNFNRDWVSVGNFFCLDAEYVKQYEGIRKMYSCILDIDNPLVINCADDKGAQIYSKVDGSKGSNNPELILEMKKAHRKGVDDILMYVRNNTSYDAIIFVDVCEGHIGNYKGHRVTDVVVWNRDQIRNIRKLKMHKTYSKVNLDLEYTIELI